MTMKLNKEVQDKLNDNGYDYSLVPHSGTPNARCNGMITLSKPKDTVKQRTTNKTEEQEEKQFPYPNVTDKVKYEGKYNSARQKRYITVKNKELTVLELSKKAQCSMKSIGWYSAKYERFTINGVKVVMKIKPKTRYSVYHNNELIGENLKMSGACELMKITFAYAANIVGREQPTKKGYRIERTNKNS